MTEWLSSKRTQITNVGEDVEKREPLYTFGGNVNCCYTVENSMEVSQKNKTRTTTPGYIYQNTYRKDTCTPMFIAALFTVAKIWKQPKCPSTDEWIKKMLGGGVCAYIYTDIMEYYSAIK